MSQNANSITISAFTQTIQTQSIIGDVNIGGNTTGTTVDITSGTLFLAGGNRITLSQNANSITISGPSAFSAGISTDGNTAGTTGFVSRSLQFVGGNNITLSQSLNGASATLTILGGAGGGINLSISGNTSGTSTLINTGTAILAGGNNITLSQNGQNITISAVSTNSVLFTGVNNITVSGSTNGASQTISIGQSPIASFYENARLREFVINGLFPGDIVAQRITFPNYITATEIDLIMSISQSTSLANTFTLNFGIYSITKSTITLLSSNSTSFGWVATAATNSTNSNNAGFYIGTNIYTAGLASWGITPGDYMFIMLNSFSTSVLSAGYQGAQSYANGSRPSNTIPFWQDAIGSGGSTFPATFQLSQLSNVGVGGVVGKNPYFIMAGTF